MEPDVDGLVEPQPPVNRLEGGRITAGQTDMHAGRARATCTSVGGGPPPATRPRPRGTGWPVPTIAAPRNASSLRRPRSRSALHAHGSGHDTSNLQRFVEIDLDACAAEG